MINQKQKTKITQNLEKAEKNVFSIARTLKKSSLVIGLLLAIIFSFYNFYLISGWYDRNRVVFQVPAIDVTVYWPVVIEDRKIQRVSGKKILSPIPSVAPEITPKKTSKLSKGDIVARSKYPVFIDHIWLRESGRGTATAGLNVSCANKGMSNEIGYYPSGGHCFQDFETSVKRLERWYEDNSTLTDNQKLCRYNSGTASESCAYLGMAFKDMN